MNTSQMSLTERTEAQRNREWGIGLLTKGTQSVIIEI